MAYVVFTKNSENIEGSVYKIAENDFDLNNLNINKSDYTIIEISQSDFNNLKLDNKSVKKYNGNIVSYDEHNLIFPKKNGMLFFIEQLRYKIKFFLDNNKNHTLYNKWNDYYLQLGDLNLENIQFPLNKSLEQYLSDEGKTYLHPLQLP